MFVSTRKSTHPSNSFTSRYGATKSTKVKSSFKEKNIQAGLQRSVSFKPTRKEDIALPAGSALTSPIITICVGPEQRLFAGHEHIISRSPYFQAACKGQFLESQSRRIDLPNEQPEILSVVLEYLYKGDYYPRLMHNKRKDTWELEDESASQCTIYHNGSKMPLLKDTIIYCAADKYGLEELKRLALRKQGLQAGIQVGTILASARYAYSHTPDSDSKLRAHYLALIIRSRQTFKKSATMQSEMEAGGRMFFDLFVAMCNHLDDLSTMKSPSKSPFTRSPKPWS